MLNGKARAYKLQKDAVFKIPFCTVCNIEEAEYNIFIETSGQGTYVYNTSICGSKKCFEYWKLKEC